MIDGLEIRVFVFNAFALLASLYAFTRGGAPERVAGGLLLAAAILTRLVEATNAVGYVHPELGVLAIDLALLVGLVLLALRADRFWPFWIVALHALGTLAHLAKAVDPAVLSLAYAILTRVWSYPITLILIVATVRHERRLASAGMDMDWSPRPHG